MLLKVMSCPAGITGRCWVEQSFGFGWEGKLDVGQGRSKNLRATVCPPTLEARVQEDLERNFSLVWRNEWADVAAVFPRVPALQSTEYSSS